MRAQLFTVAVQKYTMTADQLPEKQRNMIFWASFLSLAAAGFGFAYRVMALGEWQTEFDLTGQEAGVIFGWSLWPIAITMILFSLIVDKVGHKLSMYLAFTFQALSVLLSLSAKSPDGLKMAALCAGLGHGIVEAVINPVCSTMYPKDKTRMLNILHAAWPAGLAVGGALVLLPGLAELSLGARSIWMLIPVIAYGIMLLPCKFPIDERVQNNISYSSMLKEVGFLAATLAFFLLSYELLGQFIDPEKTTLRLVVALVIGFGVGGFFGAYTKSLGKILYFILCLLMIPLATTELGTDAWIKELMTPTMGEFAGWAIVLSAVIMMGLRFQAGLLAKRFSPPTILVISSFFSLCGLMTLSVANGFAPIIFAFVLYAIGQTFYWPTVLGFAAEQYPKGGALSLNTVSAIGLLSVGIIGTPIIGSFRDNHVSNEVKALSAEVYESSKKEASFFGVPYTAIDTEAAGAAVAGTDLEAGYSKGMSKATRKSLRTVAFAFPGIMLVSFILIALFYRSKGGYKAVELTEGGDASPS